ncbi:hypothetical protein ACG02S_00155 [Roseateles sp. DC23W]|uniref:Peptidase C39-like domain-containing protein n=1 Tax=Pelomonas dachongensis TaxID=3299029 RepID=A0ABW7EH95_9BURK
MEMLRSFLDDGGGSAALLKSASRNDPWKEVVAQLVAHDAKMLLVQSLVVDQDFIEEHKIAYAQQHRQVDKWCLRVHAFRENFRRTKKTNSATHILNFIDRANSKAGCYLGFVTLRPLRHAPVGATFLQVPANLKINASDRFNVQLTGVQFSVQATPFLQQESAAGACAQASIWMALRTISQHMKRQRVSVAELTLAASRQTRFNRRSPGTDGLTVGEMIEALKAIGWNYFHFDIPRAQETRGDIVFRTVGPYLDSGLPVVMSLRVGDDVGHAVVAIGREMGSDPMLPPSEEEKEWQCQFSEGWTAHLTVNNDNTGPYVSLPMTPRATKQYAASQAKGLIIPLPSAVLMSARQAQLIACELGLPVISRVFTITDDALKVRPDRAVVLRTYLCSRHAWRSWVGRAKHMGPEVRSQYRSMSLPELMWIVELHDADSFDPAKDSGSCCGEMLFDAASNSLHGESFVAGRAIADLYEDTERDGELLVWEAKRYLLFVASTGTMGPGIDKPDYV